MKKDEDPREKRPGVRPLLQYSLKRRGGDLRGLYSVSSLGKKKNIIILPRLSRKKFKKV